MNKSSSASTVPPHSTPHTAHSTSSSSLPPLSSTHHTNTSSTSNNNNNSNNNHNHNHHHTTAATTTTSTTGTGTTAATTSTSTSSTIPINTAGIHTSNSNLATATNTPSSSPQVSTSVERRFWMNDRGSRRSSTSLTQQPLTMNRSSNKLHAAVSARDLTRLKQRLSQPRKAKIELAEYDSMDQTPLCAALRNGSHDIVREILFFYQSNKMDINDQDKSGYTPLHVAASHCDDQILMLLLNYEGINVNITNEDKNSALHYFCQKFRSPNCQEPFSIFLKKGVNVNAQNKNGETPLHKSIFNNTVRLLMVNMLLDAGAEVNVLNSRGESPLHFAVRLGREDLVSVLVKAGADITIKGNEKKTCYELSLTIGNQRVINFLKNVQDIFNWLKSIDLEQYWLNFVKEEIFMDLLLDIDERTLDSLGITYSGHRLKIIRNCRILRDQQLLSTANSNVTTGSGSSGSTTTTTTTTTTTSGCGGLNVPENKKVTQLSIESLKSNPPNSMDSTGSISSDDLKESLTNLEHWVIDHSELEYTLKLGSGSSGKVYKGLYKGKEVAVKVLKSITTQSQLEEFKKEFQIMGSIRSQFMVTFYGACIEPKLCMVMEYCSRDSLYHVMNTKKYDIGWDRFFQFTMQMTLGVQCLHNWTPQIVHRDFKSLNLLVNEDWECKVSDFGLSRFNTADNLETLSKIRGTFAYCSPEVAVGNGSLYTTKSDIYSIGIVFWELVTRVINGEYSRPYSEYSHIKMDFQIMLNSKEGLRPTLPQNTPPGLEALYKQCVNQEQTLRPSCEEIIETLNRLRHEYMSSKTTWDSLIRKLPSLSPPPQPTTTTTTTTSSSTSTNNINNNINNNNNT
ncbi:ankyrin repeat-containing protein [Dictyostelium discoideum AX4]|uniref:Probable serine/threonine-protein kinase DDB_G0278535 n=1 Tax=Dictyostelium discoideum TaxID=44689 RepID=Y9849_DICDI|nr:ankyrin repeat-containing protein [Dictyostelium discoideum AX4]Q54XX5.1 RecName: Full=Probable serine/threonine-protein kinase DDB_G0278535 [Dictyostelium discoideum]EAL68440.1 ankyrin repeat-containing protein [Dictyostelium discoideum AX4]|eukprot:XP_642427.1 ankyrin repeat-containing protein [Dictyostelium discoideum AX4]